MYCEEGHVSKVGIWGGCWDRRRNWGGRRVLVVGLVEEWHEHLMVTSETYTDDG